MIKISDTLINMSETPSFVVGGGGGSAASSVSTTGGGGGFEYVSENSVEEDGGGLSALSAAASVATKTVLKFKKGTKLRNDLALFATELKKQTGDDYIPSIFNHERIRFYRCTNPGKITTLLEMWPVLGKTEGTTAIRYSFYNVAYDESLKPTLTKYAANPKDPLYNVLTTIAINKDIYVESVEDPYTTTGSMFSVNRRRRNTLKRNRRKNRRKTRQN